MNQVYTYFTLFLNHIVPVQSCLMCFENPLRMSGMKLSQIFFVTFRKTLRCKFFFKVTVIYIFRTFTKYKIIRMGIPLLSIIAYLVPYSAGFNDIYHCSVLKNI